MLTIIHPLVLCALHRVRKDLRLLNVPVANGAHGHYCPVESHHIHLSLCIHKAIARTIIVGYQPAVVLLKFDNCMKLV